MNSSRRARAWTPAPTLTRSLQEHAVSVGIEPVFLLDSMAVGVHHGFFSSESAHQHQQRGLWQVEIREQRTHDPKFVAAIDKYIGLAAARAHSAVSQLTGHIFESAYCRGSDRDDTSSCCHGMIDSCGCLGRNFIRLTVQSMIFNLIHANRLKGPKPD